MQEAEHRRPVGRRGGRIVGAAAVKLETSGERFQTSASPNAITAIGSGRQRRSGESVSTVRGIAAKRSRTAHVLAEGRGDQVGKQADDAVGDEERPQHAGVLDPPGEGGADGAAKRRAAPSSLGANG